jgi:transketolase
VTSPSPAPPVDTRALAKRTRIHALKMTSASGSSHIGAVLSMADIVAVLYGGILRVDPQAPEWPDRDRFILSKGHAGAGIYAALAERGFIALELGIPGVDLSTGSLGHGLSVGAGMAYGARLDGRAHRVFVLLSDGECDEGSTWEAVLFAGHHALANLVAIVDYNGIQSLATVSETVALEPFADKWRSFGWGVVEVDGHDHAVLWDALAAVPRAPGRPTVIIAHTIKGKGVSFMENTVLWHYRTARGDEFDRALKELTAQ